MTITLASDGRGWIDGQELSGHGTVDEARTAALRTVAARAQERGRSVRVAATDPDGRTWRLVVHPNGRAEEEETVREAEDPDAVAVPAHLRPRTDAVGAAVAGGHELDGARLARELESDMERDYGTGHPYVWRARELTAHATMAIGMPGAAAELYMEAARGWHTLNSPAAYREAAQRAYACWCRVEETADLVWGGELLVDLLRLRGEEYHGALRDVLSRIDEAQALV
ncbi:hypothetical protein GCM10009801_73220 [Streptomyces albiaxialis]|uniref:Uncharacterized protein n=2 Tax=Streptomyces albiaxialis TaxID=329523 RepID=A0ABP5IHI7_9ACTN